MAISLVGSGAGTHNATGGSTYTFTSLRDAANAQPTLQENDLVVVVTSIAGTANLADGTMTPTTPTGYAGVYTPNLGANDSHDSNLQVSWKFMGSSPDTSVDIRGVPATTNSCAYLVFVFRGVDTTTPFDVTSTSASSNNSGTPNAPAITPSTAGAWILCFGGSAMATGTAPSTTPPTGMDTTTNHFRTASLFTQTNDAAVAGGIKSNWTSGAYDPAAFGGFNTTNTGSWTAASLALRPAALNNYSLTADQATVSASGIANRTLYARRMLADVRSFTVTTVAAGLVKGRMFVANAQSWSITTVAAGTKYGRSFPAALATVSLTGPPNRLLRSLRLSAAAASYAFTTVPASLFRGRKIVSTPASVSITTQSATFRSTYILHSVSLSVSIAGVDVDLRRQGALAHYEMYAIPTPIVIAKAAAKTLQFGIDPSSANMVRA